MEQSANEWSTAWTTIRDELKRWGCDCGGLSEAGETPSRMKVVCVAPDLRESHEEMGRTPRDKVVMVRLDQETIDKLDGWVETRVVGSRSEAAALFIREGLKVRAAEFDQLQGALQSVSMAKEELREKARQVFGGEQ